MGILGGNIADLVGGEIADLTGGEIADLVGGVTADHLDWQFFRNSGGDGADPTEWSKCYFHRYHII